jgi:hypothetical protein
MYMPFYAPAPLSVQEIKVFHKSLGRILIEAEEEGNNPFVSSLFPPFHRKKLLFPPSISFYIKIGPFYKILILTHKK